MQNSRLREAAPTSVNVTVGKRSREYLTDREVERLRPNLTPAAIARLRPSPVRSRIS
jgi:hypothetical protein